MIEIELSEFAKNVDYYLNKENEFFLSYNDKMYVLVGENNDVNLDYCVKNNIEVINIKHRGGTLVLTENAIGFAHIGKDIDNDFSNSLIDNFVLFLRNKGLDARFNGNDVLVSGYKVASVGKIPYKNKTYFTFQISIDNDPELIKNICLKPMVKIPKGLSEFGISTAEIIEFIKYFVFDYENQK